MTQQDDGISPAPRLPRRSSASEAVLAAAGDGAFSVALVAENPGALECTIAACDTHRVKRRKAVELGEEVLRNLDEGKGEWPLCVVTVVYVFGSFARGALEPGDLDIDIEVDHHDRRWLSHFVTSMAYGRNPHAGIRMALAGRKRSCEFIFGHRERADFEMTLLWRRGDDLLVALERLHAIPADPTAGRAVRDAMLPEFEGLNERLLPRPCREALGNAVQSGAIALERLQLPEGVVSDRVTRKHLDRRWKRSSPLYRAGCAVLADWQSRRIDFRQGNLHGVGVSELAPRYFAGFDLRYFGAIPWRLAEQGGVEWTEVLHPTRVRPLECLRITPLNRERLRLLRFE